jgi:hypothetical protein
MVAWFTAVLFVPPICLVLIPLVLCPQLVSDAEQALSLEEFWLEDDDNAGTEG